MNCADYQEWISADLDGELSSEHVAQLHKHMRGCATCRQIVEDYKVNRILLAAMEPRHAPADAWARLTARIEGRPTRSSSVSSAGASAPVSGRVARERRSWKQALRAAAAVVVTCVGGLAWLGWTDPDVPVLAPPVPVHAVRPKVLMQGHAYLQAGNPVADRSAWHYLATDDDNVASSSDEEDPNYAGWEM